MYYGMIQQATGEDWNDVKLSLSTAMPSVGGTVPDLGTQKLSFKVRTWVSMLIFFSFVNQNEPKMSHCNLSAQHFQQCYVSMLLQVMAFSWPGNFVGTILLYCKPLMSIVSSLREEHKMANYYQLSETVEGCCSIACLLIRPVLIDDTPEATVVVWFSCLGLSVSVFWYCLNDFVNILLDMREILLFISFAVYDLRVVFCIISYWMAGVFSLKYVDWHCRK